MSTEEDIINSVKAIQKVFDNMDKDFTIWEYRKEIYSLLTAGYFIKHIYNHFKDEHPDWEVKCKICNDTLTKIHTMQYLLEGGE